MFPEDGKRFAFSIPSSNFQGPYQRYQWKVLHQGMKNSPTLCQKFVDAALIKFRFQYNNIYCIHYMDAILISHKDFWKLSQALQDLIFCLSEYGLIVAPQKIQTNPPFNYLGRMIKQTHVSPQKLQLRLDKLNTLKDFQKPLGDINWIRPYLKLTTGDLAPLFAILGGDSHPNSSRMQKKNKTQNLQFHLQPPKSKTANSLTSFKRKVMND